MTDGPGTAAEQAGTPIRTPDQRIRLFVSSTLRELAAERAAARSAITSLHLTAIMFETGARHHPAREVYRAYLAQSDVFIGIYWQQYGWVAPDESVSGLEDEYLLAEGMPKLIYVKAAEQREPRLTALLDRLKVDDAVAYKHFDTAAELGDLLADDLAVLLTERFNGHGRASAQALRAPSLPAAATALVGRESETAAIGALLEDATVRLVTLLGPGGIGKTRLALEVAHEWAAVVPDGERPAWFVDLAAVCDSVAWVDAFADALGVRPEGSAPVLDLIIDRLRGHRALVVFDNFEQVSTAATELSRFLAACPEVTVLVTSRIALRLRGEREIQLAALTLPDTGPVDVQLIGRSAAVELFVSRAAAVRPGFDLTAANAAAVAELCRRLDGIPLALELAAAQLRILTPAALLSRLGPGLDRSLDLAAGSVDLPDRQRTLRATIQWSYGLLDEPERALLARLSVFTGAWTVEAAECIGTVEAGSDALAALTSLVTQSLVRTDESNPEELRFSMLDTIKAYAAEMLAARGEADATTARLAHYLVGVVIAVQDALQGPDHREVADRLDRERDDIRSAIDWALRNDDAETVSRLLAPLFTYWDSRGLLPMTHELAEQAALLPSADRLPPYATALLSGIRGIGMVIVGQAADAEPLMRRMLETVAGLGNARLRAYGLFGLGVSLLQRSPGEAHRCLDEAIAGFRGVGDQWGLALTLSTRGQWALLTGDHAAATSMHAEGLAAANAIHNDHLRAQLLDMLGLDALTMGDLALARTQYAGAVELHLRMHDYEGSAYALTGLAGVAAARGRPEAAARLMGAARHARHVIGVAVWPGMGRVEEATTVAVTASLGTPSFAAATAEGGRMALGDALHYGLAATTVDLGSDPFLDWAPLLRSAP